MIQKINSAQNNITFGKLIPIKEYKGVPKLTKNAINGYKSMRNLGVETNSIIIGLNGLLARREFNHFDKARVLQALEKLKDCEQILRERMSNIKLSGKFKTETLVSIETKIMRVLNSIADICSSKIKL